MLWQYGRSRSSETEAEADVSYCILARACYVSTWSTTYPLASTRLFLRVPIRFLYQYASTGMSARWRELALHRTTPMINTRHMVDTLPIINNRHIAALNHTRHMINTCHTIDTSHLTNASVH